MAPFVVRRSERIDYRVPVTLFAARDNVPPVLGRSLDVSEGGMRVLAPIPMPVGAVVRCELTLDGRSALLEGRVAWLSQASAPLPEADDGDGQALGIGIRFETLTREESGVLRKLISQATEGYMPAELELHGVRAPVAARAVPTPTGARISAALPWLKRGAPVGVRFIGEPADVRGHVADASLRELPNGGRRLQIEVEAEAPPRARRDTQYGDALEFERARPLGGGAIDVEGVDTSTGGAGPGPSASADAPSFEAPAKRVPGWLLFAAGLALGVAATAAFGKYQQTSRAPVVRLTTSEAQAALQAGSLSAAADARAQAPHSGHAPAASAATAATAVMLAPSMPAADETATEQALRASAPSSASAPAAEPMPVAAAAPQLVSSPNAATVRLPFEGTLEGMTSRIWADPYALAIDLPHGASAVALGRHALNDPEGIVSLVRLQSKGRALLVRLNLKRPIASHSVALTRGLLELHVVTSASLTTPQ